MNAHHPLALLGESLTRLSLHIAEAAPALDRKGTRALHSRIIRDVSLAQAALRVAVGMAEGDSTPVATALAIEIGKSDVLMGRRPRPTLRVVAGTDVEARLR